MCPDCWWPVDQVAQLDGIEADIEVSDGVSIARYRFDLSNPADKDRGGPGAEGRIVFPVPAGSSVTDLVLSGGPETLEGKLLDADDATRIYEDIVRRLIDPALLRSLEGDMYEVRAFPVPAGEERSVSFTVTTPLLAEGEQAIVEVPWSRMSPRPASGLVNVDVDVPWEVRSAIAPGFDLDEERRGEGEIGVGWESVRRVVARHQLPPLPQRRRGPHRHAPAGLSRVAATTATSTSSSRRSSSSTRRSPATSCWCSTAPARWRARRWRRPSTPPSTCSTTSVPTTASRSSTSRATSRTFADELRPASEAAAGIDYVRSLAAGGNTNISGALERGMEFLDGERPGTVVFLTDGLATVGIESAEGILDLTEQTAPDRTQLFAFGVGYDVDTVLLDALATEFTGSSHYVTPEQRIDTEVARLWEMVSTPVLSDVEIAIDGVETWDLAPAGIPGIFAGSQALLAGRYDGAGEATVTVTGNSAGGPETFVYDVRLPRARHRGSGHLAAVGPAARRRPAHRAAHRGRPRLARGGDRGGRQPVRHRDPVHGLPRRGAGHAPLRGRG